MAPDFAAALAIAGVSNLVALVPESFGRSDRPRMRSFELPVRTEPITVSQMWHPRLDADPAHRWLREMLSKVCRGF